MGGTTLGIDDAIDLFNIETRGHKQVSQQDAPLVGGLHVHCEQAPLRDEVTPFEGADGDVAVACIKR